MMQFDFFFAGKNAKHSQISWIGGVWGCHQFFSRFFLLARWPKIYKCNTRNYKCNRKISLVAEF